MKLSELLEHIALDTIVWVSTSMDSDECIYFGEVGNMTVAKASGHKVSLVYPEHYKAKYCTGLTIIVTE